MCVEGVVCNLDQLQCTPEALVCQRNCGTFLVVSWTLGSGTNQRPLLSPYPPSARPSCVVSPNNF